MLLFFHNSNGQQNSPSVELWWENIERNQRRANTEPSIYFRRANTEPYMHFKKAFTEPSMQFRKANTETYSKYIVSISNRGGKVRVFRYVLLFKEKSPFISLDLMSDSVKKQKKKKKTAKKVLLSASYSKGLPFPTIWQYFPGDFTTLFFYH